VRLLRVELDRFRARRAIALMLVGAALLTALIAFTTIWETRPVSDADRARAEAQAAAQAREPYVEEELARCQQDPATFLGPGSTSADCAEAILPRPEWFLFRSQLSLEEENRDSGLGVLVVVAAFMVIVGTTFAGADWASGSLSNQLLFEPRRTRVWLAKAAAVLLGALAATTVIVVAFWVALYLVADSRGLPTGATVQEAIRWTAGRGVVLAAAAAVGGYALTMLVRHTVGTLAVLFGYTVGGEILIASLPVEGIGRWSLANNVFAWLRGRHEYFDASLRCQPGIDHCEQSAVLTLGDAGLYLGGLLLLASATSLLLFHRRDVP
jgi:ABC-2 type transport system permease protein